MSYQGNLINFIKKHDVLAFDNDTGEILYQDENGHIRIYNFIFLEDVKSTIINIGDRQQAIEQFLN